MQDGSHPDQGDRAGPGAALELIDIGPLMHADQDDSIVARRIDRACRELGFFRITGHGIEPDLLRRLDRTSRDFFSLPDAEKESIAMAVAGPAWRGWFPLRGEVTSGRADRKEGLYVGVDHPHDQPRVVAGTPLHGRNLYPDAELAAAVDEWMTALRPVADAVMQGIALGLGLTPDWFERHLTGDPTFLFRVFRYPALPDNDVAEEWGVGEHTDYGLLTLLAQDDAGGLEVRAPDGEWIDVPAEPGALVCNIGDMLDRMTEGRYRSTPHRVRNTSGRERLSFPYFFDPSWDAVVPTVPLAGSPPADDADRRWDGTSVRAWDGPYGDYLTDKVSRVFPDLFAAVSGDVNTAGSRSRSPSADRDG